MERVGKRCLVHCTSITSRKIGNVITSRKMTYVDSNPNIIPETKFDND